MSELSQDSSFNVAFADTNTFAPQVSFDNADRMQVSMRQTSSMPAMTFSDSNPLEAQANIDSGDLSTDMSQMANGSPENYNTLRNKPSINDVTLEGNLELSDLQLRAIYYDSEENWNAQPLLIAEEGAIYIYVKGSVREIKVGDGESYLIDLPFLEKAANYGVCSTFPNTQVKEVTIPGIDIYTGLTIHVEFLYSNTAVAPKLSLNGSAPKNMVLYGSVAFGSESDATTGWHPGAIVALTYNGRYWVRDQGYNTNTLLKNELIGNGYGVCWTSSIINEKYVSLTDYMLSLGGIVSVYFANDVMANALLNINGQGARYIYFKTGTGASAKIRDNVIKAGDIGTFVYNGTQYQLLSVDRMVSNSLPTDGEVGDILVKTENGVAWVNPASVLI